MKKIYILCLFLTCIACDDGDLQIETLDFDSIDLQTCEAISAANSDGYVLFKINSDEALILELPSTAFQNAAVDNAEFPVSMTGSTKITYRIFDDTVTNNYFCSSVPLGTPQLTEEVIAQNGMVFITTTTTDDMTYTHTIALSGISLETGSGQRITDLRINDFGVVTTTAPAVAP